MMISGRGGMGSHKHGISGKAPRSPRYKHNAQIEANKVKPRRRLKLAFSSVTEAMKAFKRK